MTKLKYTTADFIKFSKDLHGDRYDYSLSEYTGTDNKISIICKIHGTFYQSPYNHLRGKNCPKCSGNSRCITTDDFIIRAKEKHGKYDYTKSVYVSNKEKLIIICNDHGEFMQTPSDHLGGKGCKVCANLKNKNRGTTSIFIHKSNLIHRGTYIYRETRYINAKTKVKIICKSHGEFSITPNDHLAGKGCKVCAKEKMVLTKHLLGQCRHPEDISKSEKYRQDVWKYTNANWRMYSNVINPGSLIRGQDFHLDHIYSMQQGFANNIPAYIIGHYTNLQIIPAKDNLIKNNKCGKILEQVYKDYYSSK